MSLNHYWQYCSLGGAVRVKIGSGEDIEHLDELDEKMWTVLSCPVDGLQIDRRTLELIDSDHDGKIRVAEVVNASKWLCSVIKDKDLILKGESVLNLDMIDSDNEKGSQLQRSARHILKNLGLEKESISVEDASDSEAIFAGSLFNGDGIITPSSTDDIELQATIRDCMASFASVKDRSGEEGIDTEKLEAFYGACADFSAWHKAAYLKDTFPFGDKTEAAAEACNALKDKMSDFYLRCSLLAYNSQTADAVSVGVDNIENIGICPIATPNIAGILPLNGINPAWKAAFDKLFDIVGIDNYPGGISEGDWNKLCSRFDAFLSWKASKKGDAVEALGLERVNDILRASRKDDILNLIAQDKALEEESNSIDEVKKLMLLYRDFYRLLSNYVLFTDFYNRDGDYRAAFEIGKLYIDQRCCDLCIKVNDMSQHADMARLSGIFLIYCKCTSISSGESMDIVAVVTDGSISDLRPGKNGIFYDTGGKDWDAVITKVVDNPVSIRQAFWAPYRKFWDFCVSLINKSAADKDSKTLANLQEKASEVSLNASVNGTKVSGEKKASFDIAKFAGIFAAIGMALGYITQAITDIIAGVAAAQWYQVLSAIIAIILVISGPSCFIAWSKLHHRNLGPVLNANGWAINSKVLINILFGAKLTSVAKYPKLNLSDPYSEKKTPWWVWLLIVLALAGIIVGVLFITGVF